MHHFLTQNLAYMNADQKQDYQATSPKSNAKNPHHFHNEDLKTKKAPNGALIDK